MGKKQEIDTKDKNVFQRYFEDNKWGTKKEIEYFKEYLNGINFKNLNKDEIIKKIESRNSMKETHVYAIEQMIQVTQNNEEDLDNIKYSAGKSFIYKMKKKLKINTITEMEKTIKNIINTGEKKGVLTKEEEGMNKLIEEMGRERCEEIGELVVDKEVRNYIQSKTQEKKTNVLQKTIKMAKYIDVNSSKISGKISDTIKGKESMIRNGVRNIFNNNGSEIGLLQKGIGVGKIGVGSVMYGIEKVTKVGLKTKGIADTALEAGEGLTNKIKTKSNAETWGN